MDKLEALSEIFDIENIRERYNKLRKPHLDIDELLASMSKHDYNLIEDLKVSYRPIVRFWKTFWPDKLSKAKICNHLFTKYGLRYCTHCRQVLPCEEFYSNKATDDGLSSHCRICMGEPRRSYRKVYASNKRAALSNRTPSWADLDKIKEIYLECPEGMHVDHIIPLRGKLVSGFHIESNLQYLSAIDNIRKNNSFNIE